MCDVLGGSCDCGSHMSLGCSCVHWVWEEGHVLGGHCGHCVINHSCSLARKLTVLFVSTKWQLKITKPY